MPIEKETAACVLAASLYREFGVFQGIIQSHDIPVRLFPGHFWERDRVETDPAIKQLMPYAVVHVWGLGVVCYNRGKSGDDRLHKHWSIGVGGHVNDGDCAAQNLPKLEGVPQRCDYSDFAKGALREYKEELGPFGAHEYGVSPVWGLVNEDLTAISRSHVGLLHTITIGSDQYTEWTESKEGELFKDHEVFLAPIAQIIERSQGDSDFLLESWSQHVAHFILAHPKFLDPPK